MPFQKGHTKIGGKKSGSHNKITRDILSLLDQLKCNPIEGLARIATDAKIEIGIRLRAYSELAKYVHPQLKAIEHSGSITGGIAGPVESARQRILRKLSEAAAPQPPGNSPL